MKERIKKKKKINMIILCEENERKFKKITHSLYTDFYSINKIN